MRLCQLYFSSYGQSYNEAPPVIVVKFDGILYIIRAFIFNSLDFQ